MWRRALFSSLLPSYSNTSPRSSRSFRRICRLCQCSSTRILFRFTRFVQSFKRFTSSTCSHSVTHSRIYVYHVSFCQSSRCQINRASCSLSYWFALAPTEFVCRPIRQCVPATTHFSSLLFVSSASTYIPAFDSFSSSVSLNALYCLCEVFHRFLLSLSVLFFPSVPDFVSLVCFSQQSFTAPRLRRKAPKILDEGRKIMLDRTCIFWYLLHRDKRRQWTPFNAFCVFSRGATREHSVQLIYV